jgi:hypothetical protein
VKSIYPFNSLLGEELFQKGGTFKGYVSGKMDIIFLFVSL